MNKNDLVKAITDYMRDCNMRKPLPAQKHSFFISDEYNNTKEFVVKEAAKKMIYTKTDVELVIDSCIEIIKRCIENGEPINIYGFGTLGLNYRKPRKTRLVGTDIDVDVPGRFVPKFTYGNELRMCARLYEARREAQDRNSVVTSDRDSVGDKVEL